MARNSDAKKPQGRSAVANGNALFLGDVDGRSVIARRLRDHIDDLSAQMGAPTPAQLLLIRRTATLATMAESVEAKMAMGEEIDTDSYARMSNTLGHLLLKLGLAKGAAAKPAKVIDGHTSALLGE